jgi:hypothetical protein
MLHLAQQQPLFATPTLICKYYTKLGAATSDGWPHNAASLLVQGTAKFQGTS